MSDGWIVAGTCLALAGALLVCAVVWLWLADRAAQRAERRAERADRDRLRAVFAADQEAAADFYEQGRRAA